MLWWSNKLIEKITFWTRMDKFYCNNLNYQITPLVYSDRDVWTGLDNSFWNNKTVPFLRNWVTVSTFYTTQFSNTALNLKKRPTIFYLYDNCQDVLSENLACTW